MRVVWFYFQSKALVSEVYDRVCQYLQDVGMREDVQLFGLALQLGKKLNITLDTFRIITSAPYKSPEFTFSYYLLILATSLVFLIVRIVN